MVVKWIQKVGFKSGSLSNQLGIPEKDNIPMVLLQKIRAAKINQVITNPSPKGIRRIRVTRLLKRRTSMAITLKRMNKDRHKT